MSGTNQSTVKVTLRNPLDHSDQLSYVIQPHDNLLAHEWIIALKEILHNKNQIEKNYCFLGFPNTARNLEYLCGELNKSISTINFFFNDYQITETYSPEVIRDGLDLNHDLSNILHNHFEKLQGTVWNLSDYYKRADYETKYAIRQLNNICHEIENLALSLKKQATVPEWVRPSQITTFLNCNRYDLKDEHRQLFLSNRYNRYFGHVYMHWTQIGKTLFEVFRDEEAPPLDSTVCEAVNSLQYYSGEFDVEWGNDIYHDGPFSWFNEDHDKFSQWLLQHNLDPFNTKLSLGYLPIGSIDIQSNFGTTDTIAIREKLGNYLDIYSIEVDGLVEVFDYCWTDANYKQQQINMMRPGYDYSSRG